MSDAKKLLGGIVLVGIGLAMFVSGSGIVPAIGAILGIVGAGVVVFALTRGNI